MSSLQIMRNKDIKDLYEKFLDRETIRDDVPSASLFDAWRIKVLSTEEFELLKKDAQTLSQEQLLYFASFGILAPTSHNSVPERFKIIPEKTCIELWLDRTYVLPASDPSGKQAVISLGCVVKNIEIAADYYGYDSQLHVNEVPQSQITYTQSPSEQFVHVATITFLKRQSELANKKLLHTILKKKVIRAQYDESVVLPEHIIGEMKKTVENYASLKLALITDKTVMHSIAKYQEDADRTVFEDNDFTLELGSYLLENDDNEKPMGMRGREFGLEDSYAKRIHKGLLHEQPLLPDEIAGFARAGKVSIESSSAVAILTAADDYIPSLIDVGRAYQELVLLLCEQGFHHSVFAGIIEVEWIRSIVATTVLNTNNVLLMLFRVGKPKREKDYHRSRSARPMIYDVLLEETIQ